MSREWYYFDTADLEEILACMQDSDRYIHEGRKDKIIKSIEDELSNRSKPKEELLVCPKHHRQYTKNLGCRDCR